MFPRSLSSRPFRELSWFRRLNQLPYKHILSQILEKSWALHIVAEIARGLLGFLLPDRTLGKVPCWQRAFASILALGFPRPLPVLVRGLWLQPLPAVGVGERHWQWKWKWLWGPESVCLPSPSARPLDGSCCWGSAASLLHSPWSLSIFSTPGHHPGHALLRHRTRASESILPAFSGSVSQSPGS